MPPQAFTVKPASTGGKCVGKTAANIPAEPADCSVASIRLLVSHKQLLLFTYTLFTLTRLCKQLQFFTVPQMMYCTETVSHNK